MDNYRVGNLIGGGGMADVYYAMHVGLDRPVAMKVMKAWLAGDEEFVARFQREARICARMNHENIVQVYDMGTKNGRPYLVMELLQGETLRQRMKKLGAIPETDSIDIIKQVLAGLYYAHEQAGIIHRDIKPGNVFLLQTGTVKVMDFGIARAAAETRLTQTNAQLGTPEYMAPEQVEGKPVDARSDLYAVGVMFYEMLTGDVPFKADTPLAVLHQQVTKPAPSLPDTFSAGLRAVVAKALSKDPAGRYASAREMLDALEKLSAGKGGGKRAPRATAASTGGNNFATARRAGVAFASVAGIAAAAAVGYAMMGKGALKFAAPTPAKASPSPKATRKPGGGAKPGGSPNKVAAAAATVAVPAVLGESLSAAEDALKSAGLSVGDVSRRYSDAAGAGEVIDQSPGAGDSVKRGRSVDLVVSRGPRPEAPAAPASRPQPRRETPAPRRETPPQPAPARPQPERPKPQPAKPSGGGGGVSGSLDVQ
jgi:serine/threonine-protein kinase